MRASTNSATKASVGTLPHVNKLLKLIKMSYKNSLLLSISISIC